MPVRDVDRGWDRIRRELKTLDDSYTKVGVQQGENRDDPSDMLIVAAANEFGAIIPVTQKMRNFLHSQGLHLKDSTTFIEIPERSFIRGSFQKNNKAYSEFASRVYDMILGGRFSVREGLALLGEFAQGKIRKFIRDVKTPPNHPYTRMKKGSRNPLIDTGQMVQSIRHEEVLV